MGNGSSSSCQRSQGHSSRLQPSTSRRFRAIADQYLSVDQVQTALQQEGLESCNLIIAVDFTKSNEWTGKRSFGGRCLHHLSAQLNPYEEAMMIIGKTLSKFDDDQLIPAYGFGDVACQDTHVFSFNPRDQPCQGLESVVWRYRQLVPAVRLAGPTSFAPAINRACQIVNDSGGRFHILLLIADGQVTRSSDLSGSQLSQQESATINALVAASKLPLSVVMVGVGDGPWDMMKQFDDALPARDFDNFQFVNFTELMSLYGPQDPRREAQFALRALMEVPEQYKTIQRLGLLSRRIYLPRSNPPREPPAAAAAAPPPPSAGFTAAAAPYNSTPGFSNPFTPQNHHDNSNPFIQQQQQGFGTQANGLNPTSSGGSGVLNPMPSYPPVNGGFLGPPPSAAAAAAAGRSNNAQQQQQQPDLLSNPMFMCPITQDVMEEPVIAADGYTYEKKAIQDWLSHSNRSPMCNDVLRHKDLTPNHTLRSAIMEAQQAATAGGSSKQ